MARPVRSTMRLCAGHFGRSAARRPAACNSPAGFPSSRTKRSHRCVAERVPPTAHCWLTNPAQRSRGSTWAVRNSPAREKRTAPIRSTTDWATRLRLGWPARASIASSSLARCRRCHACTGLQSSERLGVFVTRTGAYWVSKSDAPKRVGPRSAGVRGCSTGCPATPRLRLPASWLPVRCALKCRPSVSCRSNETPLDRIGSRGFWRDVAPCRVIQKSEAQSGCVASKAGIGFTLRPSG